TPSAATTAMTATATARWRTRSAACPTGIEPLRLGWSSSCAMPSDASTPPHRGGGPAQHAPHAPPPHRPAVGTPHPQAHPRAQPGQLEGQLAPEDDDGADVLARRREPELADQARAPP